MRTLVQRNPAAAAMNEQRSQAQSPKTSNKIEEEDKIVIGDVEYLLIEHEEVRQSSFCRGTG
jgi:hypothetical protein